jgi:hypothetical protein
MEAEEKRKRLNLDVPLYAGGSVGIPTDDTRASEPRKGDAGDAVQGPGLVCVL